MRWDGEGFEGGKGVGGRAERIRYALEVRGERWRGGDSRNGVERNEKG